MAFIGMRYPVVALITAETAGAEPTYGTSGSGMVLGKAISGNLTINRNNNPLYADDTVAEDDNGITSMDIEVGVDDLTDEVRAYVLGELTVAGSQTSDPTVYYNTDGSANYVGFGYIRVRRKSGVTSYQAVWMYKVLFSETSENSQTKGERIEWQTPTLTGRGMGVFITGKGTCFRKRATFETETAAKAWLNTQANISA